MTQLNITNGPDAEELIKSLIQQQTTHFTLFTKCKSTRFKTAEKDIAITIQKIEKLKGTKKLMSISGTTCLGGKRVKIFCDNYDIRQKTGTLQF